MILTLTRSKLPPDIDVLSLSGRLIMGNNSRDVELALNDLLPASRKIIFDLAELNMIDSTGVGILVVSHGRINKEGAHLHISGAHGLACPSENEIYVAETANWRVQKLHLHPE